MFTWLRELVDPGDVKKASPEKAIVGLGNPGPRYAWTRHNAGFKLVESLADNSRGWKKYRRLAGICTVEIAGRNVLLARPYTYMNLSGLAIKPLLRQLRLLPQDLLVVHDDLDLPAGRIRLRPGGGSGGHKGVQSVIDQLGSRDFARLRIGGGRPPQGMDAVDYVLKPFSWDERPFFEKAWSLAADAARCWAADGIEAAMNRYNG